MIQADIDGSNAQPPPGTPPPTPSTGGGFTPDPNHPDYFEFFQTRQNCEDFNNYRPGEVVAAARPIVALLPPGNLKVRFYVPEAVLPKLSAGEPVKVSCDGCAPDLVAHVSFISRTSEYTPPVIYSLDERSKLVFLIEALPERPEAFRVGQPISVTIAPKKTK